MGQVHDDYTVCDHCGGVIPDTADRLQGVNGTLVLAGQAATFSNLDFCCTAHMAAWVGGQPQVAPPSPPYEPPPRPAS